MEYVKRLRERARLYGLTALSKEYIAAWEEEGRKPIPGQLDIFGNEVPIGDT